SPFAPRKNALSRSERRHYPVEHSIDARAPADLQFRSTDVNEFACGVRPPDRGFAKCLGCFALPATMEYSLGEECVMFRIPLGSTPQYCDGVSRRSFLQVGVAGIGALSLGQMLALKAASAAATGTKKDTAVILLWLDGGPGHMDTYDMKPEAPPEY